MRSGVFAMTNEKREGLRRDLAIVTQALGIRERMFTPKMIAQAAAMGALIYMACLGIWAVGA